VPTNGGAPAMNMLVGGHVDLFFTVPALAAQFVEAGKLRPLAVSSMQKNAPAEARKIIDEAVARIAADPAFKEAIAKTGSTLAYQRAADFQPWWDQDAAKIDGIIRKVAANAPK
jgi:tripartite-type tricarboxylate transporter receptor subunit TctC